MQVFDRPEPLTLERLAHQTCQLPPLPYHAHVAAVDHVQRAVQQVYLTAEELHTVLDECGPVAEVLDVSVVVGRFERLDVQLFQSGAKRGSGLYELKRPVFTVGER